MSYCETQDLAIGYGTPLLWDIALRAERGKVLALIGPNGAGKSTLLKTLAGHLTAQGGAVLLDGQTLTAYTPHARSRKLALMLPHTARTELATCFDVAAAGRYPYTGRLGILSDADRRAVHEALTLVQAEALADRDFTKISDGQRQRVLLARAVCQQPKILLLDEPTSFLDVKGKAELMGILQTLAHEKNVAIIVTLHELELAQKLADAVVCVALQGVSGVLTPQEAFTRENICQLFDLTAVQYAALFGDAEAKPKPKFEHYIRSGQKLLRCGYTTGTCAALGAAGAARLLLTGRAPETVGLRTPKGIVVEVAPQFCRLCSKTTAECAIVKDGGDDVDATTGLPVVAAVTLLADAPRTVTIDGGTGVGRVTKPGLDQPVGAAAINHVPRQMITEALLKEAETAGYSGGFAVVIRIEGGEDAAKRTFNPHLGVVGGLSVLGTSGIVEPMSQQALLDSLQLEIHQAALQSRRLILAPGNYGLDYLAAHYPELHEIPIVKISNFIGEALDMAAAEQFGEVLLVGHVGKLVKLAGGIMNTHSKQADCRTELFCAHAALCGADTVTCRALMDAATTDTCLDILDAAGLKITVMASLLQAVQLHLDRRVAGAFTVGAVLFSNQSGPLGQTTQAKILLQSWKGN
ncbi:MAG: cobalt-precorrin-5B (C(1))-methyltransferase CbiD [Subdoligranulum variabile]|uniref:cobalt-precorrin-5B (C(1))-methyltransferase CbiD n=1 Tax=Gemmiger sp. TaxID=2049027 RepID=UPI002A912A6E|nr:cobalt-precorrin-5B (C(1))-methyltransferase CbiD [Gemmiger sp.]MDD7639100.1 cobalt-precorrin-5B (C(1))-methyltransferase CbiD [Subdoligranulum variabile]MDY5605244.1 cobalt-precorrin-5B (C(1))-methyltransferase CbiD [Gemmiger sp.]